jgi:pectate lyase
VKTHRHRPLPVLRALALCGTLGACDNSGLVDWNRNGQGGTGAGAGPAAPVRSSGGSGGVSQVGSGAGAAGTGSVDSPSVECPEDDGSAAALTLAGLGYQLPSGAGTPDASSGAASDAGAADAGGGPLEFEGLALPGLVGWATQPGLGTASTIGGGAGQVVTARSAEELIAWASRPEPLVIRICGTLRAPEVRVSSHKTLLGVGSTATLEGGLRVGGEADYVRNVVIKNLRVNAASSTVNQEAVRLDRAHHVWLDHCELFDSAGDAALDVVNGSDLITVSWSKFHFTSDTPDSEHRFACRIGDHDQPDDVARAADGGRLNVTLHHDWWADDVRQRAPRARFGSVHVFNSYYSVGSRANDWSIWASTESRVLLENNYFQGVTNPHELNTSDAQLRALGNVYDGATGLMQSTGTAFSPPYAYALDVALAVPEQVRQGAGPK